jgi:cation diffusion facilitator CzcD-associated flavoprotein CzcO
MTSIRNRAIVVGAGLSGLAAARALKQAGIAVTIVDRASCIGESWLSRHPQLRLNTHRALSALPGLKMPKSDGAFPTRDTVVRYLQDYARLIDVPIELGIRVERVVPCGEGWRLETDAGSRTAGHVIIATGHVSRPVVPKWPGLDTYQGRLIHAADFGELSQYTGKSVLVIGAGNSGTDVLNHLATIEAGPIWVSVRHGPTFMPTRFLGLSVQRLSPFMEPLPLWVLDQALAVTERMAFGNLQRFGLREPAVGAATRLLTEGVAPAIDNGFVAALKAGRASIVPEIEAFRGGAVRLVDGRLIEPDVVICATGYRTGLEALIGDLDVLDERGVPRVSGDRHDPRYPGLWFAGMVPDLGGMFRVASKESEKIATAIRAQIGDVVPLKHAHGLPSPVASG